MSFGLPSVKVKPEHETEIAGHEGSFGLPNPMYHLNEEKMNMAMLRNIQGLHAPMKLSLERKFASKIGRLPFLPSSNLQHDVLTGRYLDIGFEDILNTPELREVAPQPHAFVERSLGIL
ncbi:unnamed protein product [Leptidea sinapis]|uniref:Proteasome maturation protein n=1 Tax=Leptidea sinapis TaxID=189913 RepID=A0A5E4QMA9_9NEOP|nr:unnamed protein product [Leptidea sinapis]